mgnify:CR=1 FL=1
MLFRSHNVPAQATTMGKRCATAGEELLVALERVEGLLERYPLRGIKGPVGTQQDMLDLLGGDAARVDALEAAVARHLGFSRTLRSVGQVYPRSLDLDVVSALLQAAGGPSSFAKTLRLMAGQELATEGFRPGQVGSSAMPHKMNARTCERINGFVHVLAGHLTMVSALVGDQWNEGDVSCSVVRRVALPDAVIDTFLWERDARPGPGRPQAVINEALDRADVVVLLAWKRVGDGTIEEYDRAMQAAANTAGSSSTTITAAFGACSIMASMCHASPNPPTMTESESGSMLVSTIRRASLRGLCRLCIRRSCPVPSTNRRVASPDLASSIR